MLSYIMAGLALGSIYAISSASLVVTYESAGILNFAFGSMAFTVARLYYWMNSEQGWSQLWSGVLCILVFAPLLGIVLYLALFRFLRKRSQLIKVVATIGLSVSLPALVTIIFGNDTINTAPGLAHRPLRTFDFFGTAINMDQLIIYIALVLVVLVGTALLQFTDAGLKVRAMVDSEALTSLSGTDPRKVALGVWAASGLLAGLAGILVAPTQGLNVGSMTLLMAVAFAAVVAAKLRSLPVAVVVSLVMGIVTDVSQKYLPTNSSLTTAMVSSIPFAFMLVFLLYYLIRGGSVSQARMEGGALDRAIRAEGHEEAGSTAEVHASGPWFAPQRLAPLLPIVIVAILPLITNGYWLGLIAQGIAMSIALMSFSLVTGDGGMIWLCQITFAGGGAVMAAQLAGPAGFPPLLAAIVAAVAMAPVGILIGALTIRLGELYVALVTLTFGLLISQLVFTRDRFYNFGAGVPIDRPSFAFGDRSFAYMSLIAAVIIGLVIVNLRRSTTGLAISAVRWSEPASRTLGLSVVWLKIMLSGFAAFAAGLGGALLAMYAGTAIPDSYDVFTGLVWLAVLVTIGIRSVTASILAGLAFTVVPGLVATYLPTTWGQLPPLLFGLGAIGLSVNPEGAITQNARFLMRLIPGFSSRPQFAMAGVGAGGAPPDESAPPASHTTSRGGV